MNESATLGGGCFWCLDAVFSRLEGVESVTPGYAGGHTPQPSYEAVCTGATGHAEVVRVSFDPAIISYGELLEMFFAFHDPTTVNAQGPDVGTQYRSVILTETPEQARLAHDTIAKFEAERAFGAPIATSVEPLTQFWPAEAYHRRYFELHPDRAYCAAVVAPKVAKLRQHYAARLKRDAEPGASHG